MSELSHSSQMRNYLFGLSESEGDSDQNIDTDLENTPEQDSNFHDFSLGSGEEYNDYESENDEHATRPRTVRRPDQPSTSGTSQRHFPLTHSVISDTDSNYDNTPTAHSKLSNWVRFYPPCLRSQF